MGTRPSTRAAAATRTGRRRSSPRPGSWRSGGRSPSPAPGTAGRSPGPGSTAPCRACWGDGGPPPAAAPRPAPTRHPFVAAAMAAHRLHTLAIIDPEEWSADLQPFAEALAPRVPVAHLEGLRHLWARASYVELEGDDLADATARVHAVSPNAVVGWRLALGPETPQIAADLVRRGAAVLHLYADEYGQTPAGSLTAAPRAVHRPLVSAGLRGRGTACLGGGIATAEHVPKAIACGADAVAIDLTLPTAFGW